MSDWKQWVADQLLSKKAQTSVKSGSAAAQQQQDAADQAKAAQDAKDAADKAAAQKKVDQITFKKGGIVKHQRGDGIARKGHTKGRFV